MRLARQVLVVEDEPAQQHMYTRAITRLGYGVRSARSPETALAALADEKFAIAIIDLNLGGRSGLELFETVRERWPAVSVIIATGFGTLEAAKTAVRLDAVDFLTKPVSLDALESSLSRAWSRHETVMSPIENLRPPGDAPGYPDQDPLTKRTSLNIEDAERDLICEALRRAHDNRKVAAQMLGISERKLYYRLSQFELKSTPDAR